MEYESLKMFSENKWTSIELHSFKRWNRYLTAPPLRPQGSMRPSALNGGNSDFNNRSAPPASRRNQATPATQRRPNPPVRSPPNPVYVRKFNLGLFSINSKLFFFFCRYSVIVCNCNEPAMQLAARKEGPNTGRQFHKCSKLQGTGCDFCLWGGRCYRKCPTSSNRSANSRIQSPFPPFCS